MKTIAAVFIFFFFASCATSQSDIFSAKSLFEKSVKQDGSIYRLDGGSDENFKKIIDLRKQIEDFNQSRTSISEKIKELKSNIKENPSDETVYRDKLNSLNAEITKIDELIVNLKSLYIINLNAYAKAQIADNKQDNNLTLNPNLSVNTSDNAKNSIIPELNAAFEKPFKEKGNILFALKLNIKSPSQGKDSSAVFTNIMKTGGDGVLDLSVKGVHKISEDFGGMLGVGNRFSWVYSKVLDTLSTSAYVFDGVYGFAAVKIFPLIIGLDMQYSVARKSTNSLTALLNDSWNANLLFGIKLSDYQILIKYLLWNSKLNSIVEDNRLEIKFGVDFNPF
ncbi:MAG: hypothetical protein LWX07_06620 [Bacteroidetes bacterium]|nr:hypothetical protein [Bacteroidota bacterium]